jgi:hypothetical protein
VTADITMRWYNDSAPVKPVVFPGLLPMEVPHCEIVPGTGEVARFPVETLGTHKMGAQCNWEHSATL